MELFLTIISINNLALIENLVRRPLDTLHIFIHTVTYHIYLKPVTKRRNGLKNALQVCYISVIQPFYPRVYKHLKARYWRQYAVSAIRGYQYADLNLYELLLRSAGSSTLLYVSILLSNNNFPYAMSRPLSTFDSTFVVTFVYNCKLWTVPSSDLHWNTTTFRRIIDPHL